MRRHLVQDSGQAAVEFVLLFPFVLLLVLVLVELGFATYESVTVNHAAREAARAAAVSRLPSAICAAGSVEERAITASAGRVRCGEIAVSYVDSDGDGMYGRGDSAVVRVTHPHLAVTPLATFASALSLGTFPSTFDIAVCTQTRLESPPSSQAGLVAAAAECN